jgi:hypothetical protein
VCSQEMLDKGLQPSEANFLEVDIDTWSSELIMGTRGPQTLPNRTVLGHPRLRGL